jgi:hypothetical protein
MAKHKYADLLIAYANDTSLQLQYREDDTDEWVNSGKSPSFSTRLEWRIKPTPKRAFVYMVKSSVGSQAYFPQSNSNLNDAEVSRNTAIKFGYTVTDIKEVVFE